LELMKARARLRLGSGAPYGTRTRVSAVKGPSVSYSRSFGLNLSWHFTLRHRAFSHSTLILENLGCTTYIRPYQTGVFPHGEDGKRLEA
jgi:hypothetical protein